VIKSDGKDFADPSVDGTQKTGLSDQSVNLFQDDAASHTEKKCAVFEKQVESFGEASGKFWGRRCAVFARHYSHTVTQTTDYQ